MDWQRITRNLIFIIIINSPIYHYSKSEFNDSILVDIINKSVNYLYASQIKENVITTTIVGEWPTFIYNTANIPFLGRRGKSAYDSNVFNTLFIHNALAELYLKFKKYPQIINIISLAQKSFIYYKTESSFNFWPERTKQNNLKCKHEFCKQRGPVNFIYHYKFISNYTNIYNDADDTAAGYLAYFLSNQIKDSCKTNELEYFKNESFQNNFILYRDTGNRKTNWYNRKNGFNYRTGAYLTWFGPDRKPSNFFTWFFPYHFKQNILYGRNEIDCVVNANILRTLYIIGDTTIAGIQESKKFLREVISKNKCQSCGVYYPTEFSFHYAMAKAISSGVTGFNDLKEDLINQIIDKKNENGYWNSDIEANNIQSTLYALNTILLLNPNKKTINEVEKSIRYIVDNMINEQTQIHWKGGVFFSGGSAIRYEHVWISDAYTTCLAIEALSNYLKIKNNI